MNSRARRQYGGCRAPASSARRRAARGLRERLAFGQGRGRDRFVALVDPAPKERDRHLLALHEPCSAPPRLVHAVAHLLDERLRTGIEQRARKLHADSEVWPLLPEEDEDLLADLRDILTPRVVLPRAIVLQRVGEERFACCGGRRPGMERGGRTFNSLGFPRE